MEFKNKLSSILKGKSSRAILLLASGSILAQLITLICSPIITRLYSPAQMGDYTFIITIVSLFAVIVNARYDAVIVSAKDDYEVALLSIISWIIAFILTMIITLGSIFIVNNSNSYKHISSSLILWVFPLLLIYGITNVLNGYNNRYKEYRIMSDVHVVRMGGQNIITIILGFFRMGPLGLIIGQVLGNILGIKRQSVTVLKNIDKFKSIQKKDVMDTLKAYKDQPIYSVPASFVNALSYSMINFLIGLVFGMNSLGLYSISYRILGLPLGIFSANISKVYYSNASSEKQETGNFWNSTKKTILFASIISFFMVAGLILLSPIVFSIVFGNEWKEAGVYVQILAPMFGLRLIVGSIGFNFIVARKQRTELIIQCTLLLSLVISYYATKVFGLNIKGFLVLITILYSVVYLIEIIIMIYYSRKKE